MFLFSIACISGTTTYNSKDNIRTSIPFCLDRADGAGRERQQIGRWGLGPNRWSRADFHAPEVVTRLQGAALSPVPPEHFKSLLCS